MAEQAAAILVKRCGMGEGDAAATGRAIADELSNSWGGSIIYVPIDARRKAKERADRIVAEFDGSNHNALAVKHKLGVHMVYKILAADIKRRRSANRNSEQ